MVTLTADQERRAKSLHDESIVVDTLAGGPAVWPRRVQEQIRTMLASGRTAIDILTATDGWVAREIAVDPEVRAQYLDAWNSAGVTCVSATQGGFGTPPFGFESGLDAIANTTRLIDAMPDRLVKATRAEDVRRAKRDGKHAFLMNFQNTTHFGLDWRRLEQFYSLGIRVIQLTYNSRNFVGDGCTERTDAGLSHFGVQLVRTLNEMGVLVDLSHCGERTAWDAVRTSTKPVACTHTFSSALAKHDRAKPDDLLRAVADTGGYVGVLVVPFFISEEREVGLDAAMAQVEHLVEICGIDRVGIGTDWGTVFPRELADKMNQEMQVIGFRPEHRVDWNQSLTGFRTWEEWPNITRALVGRGFSDADAAKILGLNFLRVFEAVVG